MPRHILALVAFIALLPCVAIAASPMSISRHRILDRLAARHDIDSRLARAALLRMSMPVRARKLIHRDALEAPDARDLALLDVTCCRSGKGCDALSRERRLRRIDPRNSVVWLTALHHARADHDKAAVDAALTHMAQGRRFDLYLFPLARRIRDALVRVLPSDKADKAAVSVHAGVEAISLVTVLAMPGLQDITDACQVAKPASSRGRTCNAIGRAMRRGDSLIAEMIGLDLCRRMATDPNERTLVATQQRRLTWQRDQLARVARRNRPDLASRLAIRFAQPREADAMALILQRAGIATTPPSNWRPDTSMHSP